MLDFIRIGCAVPPVGVGDVPKNTEDVIKKIREADAKGCDVVVFPELALTGYTCADLFFQETLLSASVSGIETGCLPVGWGFPGTMRSLWAVTCCSALAMAPFWAWRSARICGHLCRLLP